MAIWPAIAAFALAFVVARSFASVYECVVDTIFVCAMRDKDECARPPPSARPLGPSARPPAPERPRPPAPMRPPARFSLSVCASGDAAHSARRYGSEHMSAELRDALHLDDDEGGKRGTARTAGTSAGTELL